MSKRLPLMLLIIVMLMGRVFADQVTSSLHETQISIVNDSGVLKVSVLVFPIKASVPGAQDQAKFQALEDYCRTQPDFWSCVVKQSSQNLDTPTPSTQKVPTTLKDVPVRLEYKTAAGYDAPLPGAGCNPVITSQSLPPIQSPYSQDLITYYYGTCTVDMASLKGQNRIIILATFIPTDPTLQFAQASYPIDNGAYTSIDQFTTNVNTLVGTISSSGANGSLPCFGAFLILGLLLASMYFAGKSPISLLDIISPKLPTPKGVTAGGQILGPFGYTEMKKATRDKLAVAGKAIEKTLSQLNIGGAHKALMDSVKTKATFTEKHLAEDAAQQQAFARGLIAGGHILGMHADQLSLLAQKLPYHYGQEEHKLAAEILRGLELRGGRDALFALTIKDGLLGIRTFQSLETLTAHPDIGKRSAWFYALMTPLNKMFGSNRYAIAGPLMSSSIDSLFRSGRLMGRVTKAAIVPIIKKPLDWTGVTAKLDKKAEVSPGSTAAWVSRQLKAATDAEIGHMFPIIDKMGFHYRTLRDEVLRDEMRYVLAQIYRKHGVKFDLGDGSATTEEKMLQMGHVDMDILALSNYHSSANLERLEREIRRILGVPTNVDANNRPVNDAEKHRLDQKKLDDLIAFAQAESVYINRHVIDFAAEIKNIQNKDSRTTPEYVKMLTLTQMLDRENVERERANKSKGGIVNHDDYHCRVGGNTLRGNEIWESLVLRTMVWDGENGYLHGGLKEELISARLNTANRLATLDPLAIDPGSGKPGYLQLPDYMRDRRELEKVAKRNKAELASLFSEAGKAHFSEINSGKSMADASIADIVKFMQGGRIPRHGEIREGKMIHWVADVEHPLPPDNVLVDIKRQWFDKLTSRENIAISQWTESRFTRGYAGAFKASIEAELDRTAGSASWSDNERRERAKKLWIRDLVVQDMEQRFNSIFGHNSYGTTHETTRLYTGIIAGFMEKALHDQGRSNDDEALQFLSTLNTDDRNQRATLLKILSDHRTIFEDQVYERKADGTLGAPKKVYESNVSAGKNVMVMLQEGGYAYYKKGMILSDQDRILGGLLALKDGKGQLRHIAPEDIPIRFGDDARGQALTADWINLRQASKTPVDAEAGVAGPGSVSILHPTAQWSPFIESVKAWAKEGADHYERQRVLAGVLWEYGSRTHDYTRFWHESGVSVQPKREVTPLAPAILRHFGVGDTELGDLAAKGSKYVRNYLLPVGDWLTKIALLGAGPVLRASYDIIPTSEYYRQHSMRLASRIFSKEFERDLDPGERQAYNAVALAHGAYHQIWDYSIDRHPGRTSTSYGGHNAWAGFFQFGPSTPYGVRDNMRAYLDTGQYINFMFHGGFAMDLAGAALNPVVNKMRGIQMSMQGYASKWDSTDDALKQWDYTAPRLREAMQSLNPFAFGRGITGSGYRGLANLFSKGTNWLARLNTIDSSLETRQLAGLDFQRGLGQAPQDIFLTRKGVFMSARTDEENPGLSHTNYRKEIRMDAGMMEYLFRAQEATYLYDENARRMAMENTVRRTVSAEALAIRRDQELRGFGILQNSLWGWANPIAFLWHIPTPGWPPSLTPKDVVTKFVGWAKHNQPFFGGGGLLTSLRHGASTLMQPHKLSMTVYCPKCGTSNYRGSRCRSCQALQY